MPFRIRRKLKKKPKARFSPLEQEAKTFVELYIVEARQRSVALLEKTAELHEYLHGRAGDPAVIHDVWREAEAIRHTMAMALGGRLARMELEQG